MGTTTVPAAVPLEPQDNLCDLQHRGEPSAEVVTGFDHLLCPIARVITGLAFATGEAGTTARALPFNALLVAGIVGSSEPGTGGVSNHLNLQGKRKDVVIPIPERSPLFIG
jgi:hypothetical protein